MRVTETIHSSDALFPARSDSVCVGGGVYVCVWCVCVSYVCMCVWCVCVWCVYVCVWCVCVYVVCGVWCVCVLFGMKHVLAVLM